MFAVAVPMTDAAGASKATGFKSEGSGHAGAGGFEDVGGFLFGDGKEGLQNGGIKLGSTAANEAGDGFRLGKALTIAAVGDHSVESIDDADDAGDEGNVAALQAGGIAGAIHAFVMVQSVEAGFFKAGKEAKNGQAVLGMAIDESAFFGSERSGFFQDGVGDTDLADVVKERGNLDLIEAIFRDVHLAGDAQCPFSEASAVDSGVDVFQVEHLVKGANQRIAEGEVLLFEFFDSKEEPGNIHGRIEGYRHRL